MGLQLNLSAKVSLVDASKSLPTLQLSNLKKNLFYFFFFELVFNLKTVPSVSFINPLETSLLRTNMIFACFLASIFAQRCPLIVGLNV